MGIAGVQSLGYSMYWVERNGDAWNKTTRIVPLKMQKKGYVEKFFYEYYGDSMMNRRLLLLISRLEAPSEER